MRSCRLNPLRFALLAALLGSRGVLFAAADPADDQLSSVVIIEGDEGVATGFVMKYRDILFVATNLHVLGHNKTLELKNMRGDPIKVQGIVGAVGSDIALLRIANPSSDLKPLPTASDVITKTKIGDDVEVVGNRLGGGVATQTTGRIVGLGPSRVEVDAQFQPGNSGSPIFNSTSHEVIAVATYAETVNVQLTSLGDGGSSSGGSDANLPKETRWFGYRIDSVTKWETIDFAKWQTQMKRVSDWHTTSMDLLALLKGDFDTARKNLQLRPIIERYEERKGRVGQTPDALAENVRDMVTAVVAFAGNGAKEFAAADYYDYFHSSLYWATNVNDQARFRADLAKAFKDIDGNVQSYEQRLKH
jgi:serine protease Do